MLKKSNCLYSTCYTRLKINASVPIFCCGKPNIIRLHTSLMSTCTNFMLKKKTVHLVCPLAFLCPTFKVRLFESYCYVDISHIEYVDRELPCVSTLERKRQTKK